MPQQQKDTIILKKKITIIMALQLQNDMIITKKR